jgi:ribosomal protein S18 acetylase RimI-like enzyme
LGDIIVRAAGPSDGAAVAAFHHKVWHISFRDLAPPEALQRLDENHRLVKWTKALGEPRTDQLVCLAVQNEEIVGMAAASAPSSHDYGDRGEIFAVYIDPACQRHGLGRRLMSVAAQHLRKCGYQAAALAVVDGNIAACRFYEKLGAVVIGRATDAGPIWRSENIIYAWDDLDILIEPTHKRHLLR